MTAFLLLVLSSSASLAALPPMKDVMTRARVHYDAGRHRQALDVLLTIDEAVKAGGDHPQFRYAVARCREKLEQWPEAARAYRAMVAHTTDETSRRLALAGLAAVETRLPGAVVVDCPRTSRVAATREGPYTRCPSRFENRPPGPMALYLRVEGQPTATVTSVEVEGGRTSHRALTPTEAPVPSAVTPSEVAGQTTRHPDPSGDEWGLGLRAGVGVSQVLGDSPRWRFDPGLAYVIGVDHSLPLGARWTLGLSAAYHNQSMVFRSVSGAAYDVTIGAFSLDVLARLHGHGLLPVDVDLFAGPSVEFPVHDAAVPREPMGASAESLSLRAAQAVGIAGMRWWFWRRGEGGGSVEATGHLGLTPMGAGEARIGRLLLAAGWRL